MAQLVVRVDEGLLSGVDALVAAGVAVSRSAATRMALEKLVEEHRRRATGMRIADAYRRQPQTGEELTGLDAATRALIEEEPW